MLAWPATCNRRNPDVIYEGHCQSCQVTCVMLEVHVQPCLVAHSSNPSKWEADAGGMGIQGRFVLLLMREMAYQCSFWVLDHNMEVKHYVKEVIITMVK